MHVLFVWHKLPLCYAAAFCKSVLVFDGQEVPCHKHILAAASSVLEAMVENNHKEAIECKANIVELTEEAGRAFVRFMYTGKVEKAVMREHASAFLAMGEMYDLKELKDLAEKELMGQLTKQNMVELIDIGEFFRAEDLFEAALKITKANMTWLRSQVVVINVMHINYIIIMKQNSGGRFRRGDEAEQGYYCKAAVN